MHSLIFVMVAFSIVMPLAYAIRIWRLDETGVAAWLLVVLESTAFIAVVFLTARWDMAGLYTRHLLAAALIAAILVSGIEHSRRPWRTEADNMVRRRWPNILLLAGFGLVLAWLVPGTLAHPNARQIASPLATGRFMIVHGGNHSLINYHASHKAQRHAIDIVALNAGGFRATGILPERLEDYTIFGIAVVSPCDGEVTNVRDGLPDQVPPEADRDNASGNYVILVCNGMKVEIAHLQEGSISVEIGDRLRLRQRIGLVGNSGNTSEPHLHIHAVDPTSGNAIPFTIDGVAPARNRILEVTGVAP